MSLRSLVLGTKGVGDVGVGRVRSQHRGTAVGWMLVALLAAAPGVPGLGAGTARAQSCDPVEVATLLASDGAEQDRLGISVSISGDTAVIGAYWDDDNGDDSGSAYVFIRNDGVWTQQAKLLPDDGERLDEFGASVSLSGDTVVIGARLDDDNDNASGSAYVFTRNEGVWTQQAKLLPGEGAAGSEVGRGG